MQVNETLDPRPSRTGQNSSNPPQLSTKLRNKINELAKWRIDPSSLEFPESTCEFQGGHATVSRAFLASTSDIRSESSESGGAEGGKMPYGENPSSGNWAFSFWSLSGLYHALSGSIMPDKSVKDPSETPQISPCLRKAVAVKKLMLENDDDRERVLGLALREAGLLVELSHENIIKLEGFAEDLYGSQIWLIFPWEEHGNLKDFVASRDWEIPERISLIEDVTLGVEYLHTRNPPIYHGDLKSVNVLVNSKCRAVITDFGSARRLPKKGPDPLTQTKSQQALEFEATFCATTNTMTLTGNEYTLRWAAPELLMDNEPGLGSDIWSLGWIWYEVMTNSIPFENVRKDSMVIKHVINGNLPSVTGHIRMSLILRLCSSMIECWSVDPTKRPTAVDCRKSIYWMPMAHPDPKRASDGGSYRAHSPELLLQLGALHYHQDDCVNALKFYTDALAIYTNTSDSKGKANALLHLADVHRFQGEYTKVATIYSDVMKICADIGDRGGRANALYGLAQVHRHREEYDKAIKLCREAIQICDKIQDKPLKSNALWVLAMAHGGKKDYNQAITFFAQAKELSTDLGDRLGKADALRGIAEVCHLQEDWVQAETHLLEAIQLYKDLGDRSARAKALLLLADIRASGYHFADAIRLYDQAARIFQEIGDTDKAALALGRVNSLVLLS